MYTREEAAAIKETFWKTFGQYMSSVPSAEGQKINWINYKTGIKYLNFKTDADSKHARIAIELSHPDQGMRALMFEQFTQLKKLLESALEERWNWEEDVLNDYDKTVSRIGYELEGVNMFRKEEWSRLISFFKPRLIALDAFWADAQYGFELFK
ncbi:DUF4268 domain-containing protein [Taibaiella sp. KBW10]|uniref:DUF4268 domain-containing protein n=1 Tax=Taibaiella sp. KBW10 TaxID=2153357 RepID=UPI000F5A1D51|nr:DUF4268 domain-containing protein [Taibaiella sp. KBW10]RQO31043.1 DUF4268 domain-containing protein [Taibaiella sp. KBW10]